MTGKDVSLVRRLATFATFTRMQLKVLYVLLQFLMKQLEYSFLALKCFLRSLPNVPFPPPLLLPSHADIFQTVFPSPENGRKKGRRVFMGKIHIRGTVQRSAFPLIARRGGERGKKGQFCIRAAENGLSSGYACVEVKAPPHLPFLREKKGFFGAKQGCHVRKVKK